MYISNMLTSVALVLLLICIIVTASFLPKSAVTEHFAYQPPDGAGVWGTAPACTHRATGFQEDRNIPGRYWGWENNQSCAHYQFGSGQTPPAARQVNIDGKMWNVCANPGAANTTDGKGRKWGWENNASCVVA